MILAYFESTALAELSSSAARKSVTDSFFLVWVLCRNLKIHAVTLHILLNEKNCMPYSSGTGVVIQIAGFISGKTMSLSMSGRRGHSPGGSESHWGPDHHNLLSISPLGAIPLEAKSAGLWLVSMYLQ